jgi:hypothetical protein
MHGFADIQITIRSKSLSVMARTGLNECSVEQLPPQFLYDFVGKATEPDEQMHKVPAPDANLRRSQNQRSKRTRRVGRASDGSLREYKTASIKSEQVVT